MPSAPSDHHQSEGSGTSCACVWLTTFVFLVSILSGGALLALYIILPDSPETAWYPIAGMFLIGIPWAFWIFNCIFRSVGKGFKDIPTGRAHLQDTDGSYRSSIWCSYRSSSLVISASVRSGFEGSMIDSPNRTRKVRFADEKAMEEGGSQGGRVEGGGGYCARCTGSSSVGNSGEIGINGGNLGYYGRRMGSSVGNSGEIGINGGNVGYYGRRTGSSVGNSGEIGINGGNVGYYGRCTGSSAVGNSGEIGINRGNMGYYGRCTGSTSVGNSGEIGINGGNADYYMGYTGPPASEDSRESEKPLAFAMVT